MQYRNRREARDGGAIRYFTGYPCRSGHIAERFTSNAQCAACGLARANRRYAELGDHLRAQRMARYYADPALHIARASAWAKSNKETIAEIQKRWRDTNPDKRAAWEQKRRARKLAADGEYTAEDVLRLLTSQAGRCNNPYCGTDISDCYTVDHVVPLTRGGSNWPTNLQLLCQLCNSAKGNRTMAAWLEREAATPRYPRVARAASPSRRQAGASLPD